jgi:hypothetical protein
MTRNLQNMDLEVLCRLYKVKEMELETAILRGTAWAEVRMQRKALTQLSSVLHAKLQERNYGQPGFPTRPAEEE